MKFRDLRLAFLIFLKLIRRRIKAVIFYSALVLVVGLILVTILPALINKNTVSEGLIGTYQEHDVPEQVTNLLSEPLMETDANGRPVGKLISKWESSSDAKVFKFKLKDNLMWTDGTLVKASDLEFAIDDVAVSFPDDKTIEFKLKDSFSPFPTLLTKPVFKRGAKLVGVGPYKIGTCRQFFVLPKPCLEKSRIFITKINLEPLDKSMPKVVVRFYPNEKTAATAFTLGEIQSLLGVNEGSKYQSPLVGLMQKTSYNRVVSILYNTKDSIISNKQLRQALSHAINPIENEATASTSISPNSWAFNGEVKAHAGDMDAAKAALTRAKQTMSSDSLKKEIVLTSTPQFESIGKQVVAAWKSLGVKSVLRVESGIPQNFQALLIAQSIPQDPDQYSLWHSTQTQTNLSKYSNECCPTSVRVDKDLEDGRKITKEEDRKAKYLDFQKVLHDDAPATFLYFPKYNVVYLKKVEDKLRAVLPIQL